MSQSGPAATPEAVVDDLIGRAAAAAGPWGDWAPAQRAVVLRSVADALDAAGDELVSLAAVETHLGDGRLRGELRRTTFQLRLFADELDDGGYLGATIDHADPGWPMGPRPDLRRVLIPTGPVIVFAASNFPFAFSVAGGDTASALAAGCPVVLKAHPGHPRLSERTEAVVSHALQDAGAPAGVFSVVFGDDAGRQALTDERITAGAFTGSLRVGRLLYNLAASRPVPIPFYGELGSLNPVFVTPGALAARRETILDEFVTSLTLGAGQFCTKPGLFFVPAGSDVAADLAERVSAQPAAPLLNDHVARGYSTELTRLRQHPSVQIVVASPGAATAAPTPTLLSTTVQDLLAHRDELLVECFGPASLVVTYRSDEELLTAAEAIDGQLTATVHGDEGEAVIPELVRLLRARAGRVLWNGWPTGVSVTWAMHHGGPYPATTNALHTSVGTSAVNRFLRPVSYQSMPDALLPPPLRDDNPWSIPRRVDGEHQPSPAAATRVS